MTQKSFCRAYGLNILSSVPVPELVEVAPWEQGSDHVSITEGILSDLPNEARETGYGVNITPQETFLFLQSVGGVRVRSGRKVKYHCSPGASDKFARLFALGPGLAMVLHQRGHLVLHSSAVALSSSGADSAAIGFLGESGEGKSTMAATLYERGHQVVTDDVTPIPPQFVEAQQNLQNSTSLPLIYPGFPTLKLRQQSAAAIYSRADALPLLDASISDFPRYAQLATTGFSLAPLPLRSLYLLESGEDIRIERLPPQQALWAIIKNSYWVADLPAEQRMLHFKQCSVLVQRVPVYRLQRPRNLDLLNKVAEAVENHQRGSLE